MDMSFANQALAAEYVVKNARKLREAGLRRAAATSTTRSPGSSWPAMGVEIDTLTDEQRQYLDSWDEGT